MTEHRMQHHQRRARELNKQTKAALCALYRRMGGLGGFHNGKAVGPEEWRKDEVITSITEMEWRRLPDDEKAPDPVFKQPPCDDCGGGAESTAHRLGGTHNYTTGRNPDAEWIPVGQEPTEAGPVLPFPIAPFTPKSDPSDRDTEEQPPTANATESTPALNQALQIAGTVASIQVAARLLAPGGEGARVIREVQRQLDHRMRRYRDENPGTQT